MKFFFFTFIYSYPNGIYQGFQYGYKKSAIPWDTVETDIRGADGPGDRTP